jgi:hypothetical protein
MATVTIAGWAAIKACLMSSRVLYLPVPKISREEYGVPAMTNWESCMDASLDMLFEMVLKLYHRDPGTLEPAPLLF